MIRHQFWAAWALGAVAIACSQSGTLVSQDAGGSDTGPPLVGPEGGAPYLTSLKVSSAVAIGPEYALTPAFSPTVYDYYVQCAAGANPLNVSITASAGAATALLQPMRSPPSATTEILSMSLNENQAIVATASAASMTTQYWVRCLPHDFPELQMVKHPENGQATPGYYLIGNSAGGTEGFHTGYAMVLDSNGVPVWYHAIAGSGIDDVDDVVPGSISFFQSWMTQPVQIRHLDPWMATTAKPMGADLDTHELQVLPNGHYLAFSYPLEKGVNLTGIKNLTLPNPSNAAIFNCHIVEFEPKTGAVEWTWVATDHFDPVEDSIVPSLALQDGIEAVDLFHCNSIDIDPVTGNLLVSSRNMNSVFYVDRSTNKVVWKMGGSNVTKDGATYVPVTDAFYQQHDARLQSGWSEAKGTGQVSVFDDRSLVSGPARGLLLDVKTGAGGQTPGATLAWQYRAEGNSADRGSFRIGADGSRVIGWGQNQDLTLVFTEVSESGNPYLDFYFPDHHISYRAIKVPRVAFSLDVLRSTAGLP
jgi:hypothetical protein